MTKIRSIPRRRHGSRSRGRGATSSMARIMPHDFVRDGQNPIFVRHHRGPSQRSSACHARAGRVLAETSRRRSTCRPPTTPPSTGMPSPAPTFRRAATRELCSSPTRGGRRFGGTLAAGQALSIMTGAPMPAAPDTVYPQRSSSAPPALRIGALAKGANVRMRAKTWRRAPSLGGGHRAAAARDRLVTSLGAWQTTYPQAARRAHVHGRRGGGARHAPPPGPDLRRQPPSRCALDRAERR